VNYKPRGDVAVSTLDMVNTMTTYMYMALGFGFDSSCESHVLALVALANVNLLVIWCDQFLEI